jgi:beta-lactamase class A
MFDRRSFAGGAGFLAASVILSGCSKGQDQAAAPDGSAERERTAAAALRRIEARAKGRLGAYVYDPARDRGFGWRDEERFAHCSSFKLSLAAMMLAKGQRGEIDLDEVLHWSKADLLSHSPVTAEHVASGLSVRDLAHATLVTSDNAAANVLLDKFGGPAELTRFWRGLGDSVSRLDRLEPELNTVPEGTELDTTTPAAMVRTVAKLVLGDTLNRQNRQTLKDWMIEVETGRDRLRAGFPAGWIAGDKTGTGIGKARHTYVDLAFGGPAGRTPLFVAAYFEPANLVEPMDPAALSALADVGRVAAAMGFGESAQ